MDILETKALRKRIRESKDIAKTLIDICKEYTIYGNIKNTEYPAYCLDVSQNKICCSFTTHLYPGRHRTYKDVSTFSYNITFAKIFFMSPSTLICINGN